MNSYGILHLYVLDCYGNNIVILIAGFKFNEAYYNYA